MPVPMRHGLPFSRPILLPVLVWLRAEKPTEQPTKTRLPKALGATQSRLSPDGNTIAFSYQGKIWTGPRVGDHGPAHPQPGSRRGTGLVTGRQAGRLPPRRRGEGSRLPRRQGPPLAEDRGSRRDLCR